MNVLLVEDEPRVASFVQKGLARRGHEVRWVATGHEALTAATGGSWDVVVLDLGLPDLDGLDVLHRLRAVPLPTPVVVLTAREDPASERRAHELGVRSYLRKPFGFTDLVRALEC